MPGIMSDADIAELGDSMEAGRLRKAFEEFIAHHKETEKKLAARTAVLEMLLKEPFIFRDHTFDLNDKAPAELIAMGAEALLKQIKELVRAALKETT